MKTAQKQASNQMSHLWSQVVEMLSLSQYSSCMGGDMSYKSKAERAMKRSKSRDVQALCLDIILIYESNFEAKDNSPIGMGFDLSDFE